MSFPAYPKYKDSGVEWLGKVPEHWDVKKVSHVADLIAGFAFPSEKFGFDPEAGIPLIRGDNVTEGRLRWGEKGRYWPLDLEYDVRYLLEANDIVIQMDGSKVGKNWAFVVADDLPALLVQRVTRVRVKGPLPKFVYLLFANDLFVHYVDQAKTDPAIPHITMKNIGDYWIPLPPASDQSSIAAFLDRETTKIDGLMGEQRRLIELLKEKRQAVISHVVTKGLNPHAPMKPSGIEWVGEVPEHWRVMPLGRVTISRCDGPFGSGLKSEHYTESGVRVIRLQNIRLDGFDGADEAFIDIDYYQSELTGHDVVNGDVLIAGLGDDRNTVGRACVAPTGIEPAMVKADCFRYRLDRAQVLPEFVATQLTAGAAADAGRMSSGSTRSRIPLSVMATRKLAIPHIAEQKEIVDIVQIEKSKCDRLIAGAEHAIDLLQERRTALISAAVTGQIDVRAFAERESA